VDVNVSREARLTDHANWWLNVGTNSEPRYSDVVVDLDANPELEAAAAAVRPGDRITIANLAPDLVNLLVVAKRDTRSHQKRRTIAFKTRPYLPFDVAVHDGDKRQESYSSTLNAAYGSTDTTMVVTFTASEDRWSTGATPYDWSIEGERITVLTMAAPTGSGPYTQSATVRRSVNGVVKTHLAGEEVHMHPEQQARHAL
jgi:hypothetical protein